MIRHAIRFARRIGVVAAVIWIGAVACADPFVGMTNDPVPAVAKVDQLTTAISARFTGIDRSGRFETARQRLIASALTPSRLFGDTAVWTNMTSSTSRLLSAKGSLADGRYRFAMVPGTQSIAAAAAAPAQLGDTRHQMSLISLGDGVYRWDTHVDLNVGGITGNDAAATVMAMFAAPEGRGGLEVRRAGTQLFPRTAAALSRAIIIDSLQTSVSQGAGAARTTGVSVRFRLVLDRLATTYPRFAGFLAKYSERSESRFVVRDASGRVYVDITGSGGIWTARYRLAGGHLVTMNGAPRAMPDTLVLMCDVTLRTRLFSLGFTKLNTQFILDSTGRGRGWTIIAQQEPEWVLPPLAEHLLRSSLRRPFQGSGALFQVGVRDSAASAGRAAGPTMLTRRARLDVQESAMMRLINSFVAKLFADMDPQVEREESAFIRDATSAFQQDAQALLEARKRD